ncbi:MAG: RHS repeat-associated core domain-containing protein, partial [Saprospiraceae bacterium]|nr:RHS repeat-associated core domain-containing protein [Saprospiraceae bacterium]
MDVITYQQYDNYGREPKKFIPYTITSNGGAYRSGAASEQTAFANTWGAGGYGYAETRYEASPLNRALEQAAPGATWRIGLGHTSAYLYRGNTAAEAVRNFTGGSSFGNNQLYTVEETDENGRKQYVYTDKLGRTVMLKRQLATSPTNEDDHWARTYTVYDDFGRVAAVIPPEAAKKMKTSGNWDWTGSTYASMIFKYTYDSRGRLIAKSVPSGGSTSIWYDRLDRPVLTQDANGFKIFTRYDILSRAIVNGRYKGAATPGVSEPLFESPNTTAPHYYTAQSFPTDNNLDVYQVFYYDDYDLDNNGSLGSTETYTNPNESGYETAAFMRIRSKAAAEKIAVLKNDNSAPGTYLITRTYYDKEYSVIQVYKPNHLSGADLTSSAYDFANRLIRTRRDHTATPPGGSLTTITVREEYQYDHAGRLKYVLHKINNQKQEIIAGSTYDELDRLKEKNQHAYNYDGFNMPGTPTYLQSVDFSYNIRGWLTSINDPSSCSVQSGDNLADMFSMKLEYETNANGGTPLFNGNITSWEWNTYLNSTCGTRQLYRYYYDAADRLTTANHHYRVSTIWYFGNRYSATNISYDLNGNLRTLSRRGLVTSPSTYGDIDNLTYYFDDPARPDRLTRVVDAANATKGFVYNAAASSPHYTYDSKGNLTQDKHKGLFFAYNHLNLPNSINNAADAYITMTYTAIGEKLTRVAGGLTRNYISGIEYSGSALSAVYHAEGRCTPNGSTFYYEYTLRDHLGNARVNYRANGSSVTYLEDMHYYPFGMLLEGLGATASPGNKYRYNGKEMNDDLGLNWYDYGARWYDAAVGRWWSVDPLADSMETWSPYNYGYNNPIHFTDPSGMSPEGLYDWDAHERGEKGIYKNGAEQITFEAALLMAELGAQNPPQGDPEPAQGEPGNNRQGDPPAKSGCCGDKNEMYVDRVMGTDKALDRNAYEETYYSITIPVATSFAFLPLSWLRLG